MAASDARHIVVTRHGDAAVLEVRPMDVVAPGPGQLLVRTEAAGVAMADVQMRAGTYPEPPGLPFTPGYDVTGRVEAVGPGVAGFAPGDRVAALTVTGGYATHVLAPASHAVAVPDDVDPVVVAALVLNWVTAAQMLRRVAAVQAGDTVLVHGAAGGVGTALTELGTRWGVTVLGVASGRRTEVVAAAGGIPIDRRTDDPVDAARKRCPDGVRATFDGIGGPHLTGSRRATSRHGVVVSYGVTFSLERGLGRRAGLARHAAAVAAASLTRGPRVKIYVIAGRRGHATRHPEQFREDLAELVAMLAAGDIHPRAEALPLGDAAEAQRRLESGTVDGKLVVVPG